MPWRQCGKARLDKQLQVAAPPMQGYKNPPSLPHRSNCPLCGPNGSVDWGWVGHNHIHVSHTLDSGPHCSSPSRKINLVFASYLSSQRENSNFHLTFTMVQLHPHSRKSMQGFLPLIHLSPPMIHWELEKQPQDELRHDSAYYQTRWRLTSTDHLTFITLYQGRHA